MSDSRSRLRDRVGSRLARERLDRGFSQELLGELIGCPQQTLSTYEVGIREVPVSTLLQIAEVFRMSVADLLPPEDFIVLRDPILQQAVQSLSGSPLVLSALLASMAAARRPAGN